MAYSNSFFGLRRGSTKTMTFSVLNGVQITKDRVEGGANPRTDGQQSQRSLFANAVKFYKHSQQALFKFAYEDKRSNESDYNAFMRHNVSRSAIFEKDAVDSPTFPALGNNWILSDGSLPSPKLVYNGNENEWQMAAPSATMGAGDIAAISTILINDFGLQRGDIVTIVLVSSLVSSLNDRPSADPVWSIEQFEVNPESTDERYLMNSGNGTVNVAQTVYPRIAAACGVIFSRPIKGQPLKVSTSELVNNYVANNIIAGTYNIGYRNAALASWGATQEAILQGSLLPESQIQPLPANVVSVNGNIALPAAMRIVPGQSASAAIQFDRTYTAAEGDFTASIENVGLTIGFGNNLDIEVDASVPDGTVFTVAFKGQSIITVNVAGEVLTVDGEDSPLEGVEMAQGSDRAFVLTTAGIASLAADDFTTSSENVTVALTAAKTITVTVQEDAAEGATFNVMFRDQIIISGTVAAAETVITSVNDSAEFPVYIGTIIGGEPKQVTLGYTGPSPLIEDFSASKEGWTLSIDGDKLTVSSSTLIEGTTYISYKEQRIIEVSNPS